MQVSVEVIKCTQERTKFEKGTAPLRRGNRSSRRESLIARPRSSQTGARSSASRDGGAAKKQQCLQRLHDPRLSFCAYS